MGEPQPILRSALARLLRSKTDFKRVRAYGDPRALGESIEGDPPALMLVDPELFAGDVAAFIRATKARYPALRLIVFSRHETLAFGRPLLEAGAEGFIAKSAAPEAFISAVRKVIEGGTYVPESWHDELARDVFGSQAQSRRPLTARELEVVRAVALGLDTDGIARAIHVSPSTVKKHLAAAKEKLGVPTRAAAVAALGEMGLLGPPSQLRATVAC